MNRVFLKSHYLVFIALLAGQACSKKSGPKAADSVSGSYCDKGIKSSIQIHGDRLVFMKPQRGAIALIWNEESKGYFAQLPGKAYMLEYKGRDFALYDCRSPTQCTFSRLIEKCD